MNVTLPTNGLRVPKTLCHRTHSSHDVFLRLFVRGEHLKFLKGTRCQYCTCPCSEVFGTEIFTGYVPQEIVHVAGFYGADLTIRVDVLKEFISGKIATLRHNFRQIMIMKRDGVFDSAFAAKIKAHLSTLNVDMTITHCRQAERTILFGVFLI